PRDVRDLGHEPRAEEQERLGRFAERESAPFRLDSVIAAEHLRLDDELLAPDGSRRVEAAEEQLAHADAALAEPAERVFVEARIPVLCREVATHASAKLCRDAIRRLAEGRERLPSRVSRAGEHRVDRGAEEP